ncbi:hypothetical protein D3C83_117930 [compost metagenome]
MVEIVEVLARFVPRVERVFRPVGVLERRRKTTKQFGHGEIRFAVAVIGRGIVDDRLPALRHRGVARPQVAVQQ